MPNITTNHAITHTNVALNIGGQHVHDLLEEDHQYHTSIESINRKHHDAALDFNFQAITETDVSDVIENINPRKSSGCDSPTVPILLKKTASAIAPTLGAIFNHRIAESVWSTKWKMGEWTPLFRKADKQAKENYRSITVLPLLGKVFEHLLCKQITTYYDRIIYSRMTAYRKRHRCESTLIDLVEDWTKALDSKEKVYLLAIDMSKAFDLILTPFTTL